jgi:uncharacterized protein
MLGQTDRVTEFLAVAPELAQANGVHGISILYHAALSGRVEVADLLLAHGGGQHAAYALHGAIQFGHKETVQWLLDHGADANSVNYEGKTTHHIPFSTYNET